MELAIACAWLAAGCTPATPIAPISPKVAPRASAVASAAPAASSAPPPPVVEPAMFTAVARLPFPVVLHPVENALVVANAGPRWRGDPILGVVADGRIDWPDEMAAKFVDVGAVAGSWPDDLDVLAVGKRGEKLTAERWHHEPATGWTRTVPLNNGPLFHGSAELPFGTVVLTEPFFDRQPSISSIRGQEFPFRFAHVAPDDGCDDMWQLAVRSQVELFAVGATHAGGLVAVGRNCKNEALVEHWRAGEIFAEVLPIAKAPPLGYPSNSVHAVMPGDHDDAWIAMGFVAHVVAGAATLVAAPRGCHAVAVAAGKPWLACDESLFVRDGDGWRATELPREPGGEAAAVIDIAAFHGQLWLATRRTLWRTTAPTEKWVGPDELAQPYDEALHEAQPDGILPEEGGFDCEHNVVLLYRLAEHAPDDYRFPRAERAFTGRNELRGVRFALIRDHGQRFLAALAPSFPLAAAVRDWIDTHAPNTRPLIVCSEPEIVREVPFDLTPIEHPREHAKSF